MLTNMKFPMSKEITMRTIVEGMKSSIQKFYNSNWVWQQTTEEGQKEQWSKHEQNSLNNKAYNNASFKNEKQQNFSY